MQRQMRSPVQTTAAAVALRESFRMLPALAAFVNHIFKRMMAGDGIEYLPLIPTPVRAIADGELLPGYIEYMLPDLQSANARTKAIKSMQEMKRKTHRLKMLRKKNLLHCGYWIWLA